MRPYVLLASALVLIALAPACSAATNDTDGGPDPMDTPAPGDVGADTPTTDAPASDTPVSIDAPTPIDVRPDVPRARTPIVERCARATGACNDDADCMVGGCGGEMCADDELVTTCDCTAPTGGSCGCLDGSCAWYR